MSVHNVIIHISDLMVNVMLHVQTEAMKIKLHLQTISVRNATKGVKHELTPAKMLVLLVKLVGISNLLCLCVLRHVHLDM